MKRIINNLYFCWANRNNKYIFIEKNIYEYKNRITHKKTGGKIYSPIMLRKSKNTNIHIIKSFTCKAQKLTDFAFKDIPQNKKIENLIMILHYRKYVKE